MHGTRIFTKLSEFDNFDDCYEVRKLNHARDHRRKYGTEGKESAEIDFRLLEKEEGVEEFRSLAWSSRDMNPTHDRQVREIQSMVDMVGVQTPVVAKTLHNYTYDEKMEKYKQLEATRIPCPLQRKRKLPCETMRYVRELRRKVSEVAPRAYTQNTPVNKSFQEGVDELNTLVTKAVFTDEGEWLMHDQISKTAVQMYLDAKKAVNNPPPSTRMKQIYTEITAAAINLAQEARNQNEFELNAQDADRA